MNVRKWSSCACTLVWDCRVVAVARAKARSAKAERAGLVFGQSKDANSARRIMRIFLNCWCPLSYSIPFCRITSNNVEIKRKKNNLKKKRRKHRRKFYLIGFRSFYPIKNWSTRQQFRKKLLRFIITAWPICSHFSSNWIRLWKEIKKSWTLLRETFLEDVRNDVDH